MDPLQDWLVPGCTHTLEHPFVRYRRENLGLDADALQLVLESLRANEITYPTTWVNWGGSILVLDVCTLEEIERRNPHLDPPDCLVIPHPNEAAKCVSVVLWLARADADGIRPFWVLGYFSKPPNQFSRLDYASIAGQQLIADKYDEQLPER
jgi:hypothetical protein